MLCLLNYMSLTVGDGKILDASSTGGDLKKRETDLDLFRKEIVNALTRERKFILVSQKLDDLFNHVDSMDSFAIEKVKDIIRVLDIQMSEFSTLCGDDINFSNLLLNIEKRKQEIKDISDRKIVEEGGEHLGNMWATILQANPELRQVEVRLGKPKSGETLSHTGGYFADPSGFDSAPTIYVVPGNEEHYRKLLVSRKKSVEIVAGLLGLKAEEVTAEILQSFIFAHELGHAHDYIINFKNNNDLELSPSEAWKQKNRVEMASLPLPNVNPATLNNMIENGLIEQAVKDSDVLREKYVVDGVVDVARLVDDQNIAYRSLPKEQYADEFAVRALKNNP